MNTQFCCIQPGCGRRLICALCLVETHNQHKVQLIERECEKILQEVSQAREEECTTVCDKVQCVLSVREKLTTVKRELQKKVSQISEEICAGVAERERKLKHLLETITNIELTKTWKEAEALLDEQSSLDRTAIEEMRTPSEILEKGPKLLETLKTNYTKQPWSFSYEIPVLSESDIRSAVGPGGEVAVKKTLTEIVTSTLETQHREQREVSGRGQELHPNFVSTGL